MYLSTLRKQINEIAKNFKTQLLERIETLWYTIQLDESSSVYIKSAMLDFHTTYSSEGCIWEYIMCTFATQQHHSCTTFKALDGYISGKLTGSFCVSICKGGQLSSFITQISEVAFECIAVIHREILVSQKMST